MTQHLGLLALPVPVAVKGDPAPGDPALVVLGAYYKAVLEYECGRAWTPIGSGRPIVAQIYPYEVNDRAFTAEQLPVLTLHRTRLGTVIERVTSDIYRRLSAITVRWIMAAFTNQTQPPRDTFTNAVKAALEVATFRRRHPNYVSAVDLADIDGIHTAIPTSLSPVTVTSFDGVQASARISPARRISITTTAATGAYDTGSLIAITGLDEAGTEMVRTLEITQADGGETLTTLWPFSLPTEIAYPAQVTTDGSFEAGYADAPDIALGSLIDDAIGAQTFMMSRAPEVVTLRIELKENGPPNPDDRRYLAVEFAVSIEEQLTIDELENQGALDAANLPPGYQVLDGMDGDLLRRDGSVSVQMSAN